MKKFATISLVGAFCVGYFIYALATRPPIEGENGGDPSGGSGDRDPLAVPLLVHMHEDAGLDVGPSAGSDFRAVREGDRVRVTLSPALIERLGPGSLERLSMVGPEKEFSWDGYLRFLNAFHLLYAATVDDHDHHDHAGEGPHHEEE